MNVLNTRLSPMRIEYGIRSGTDGFRGEYRYEKRINTKPMAIIKEKKPLMNSE